MVMEKQAQWKEWFEKIRWNFFKIEVAGDPIDRVAVIDDLIYEASNHLSAEEFDYLREVLEKALGMKIKNRVWRLNSNG